MPFKCRLLLSPILLSLTCSLSRASEAPDLTVGARQSGPTLDHTTADEMVASVMKTLQQGLPPRSQKEFDEHARHLHELLARSGPNVDQNTLHSEIRDLLNTIDADGHTGLLEKAQIASFAASTQPEDAQHDSTAYLVNGAGGQVLVVTPPKATYYSNQEIVDGTGAITLAIEDRVKHASACGLVIDLSDQTGGNAWPALFALGALVTPDNKAYNVDRNNVKTPVVTPSQLAPDPRSPLSRFRGQPVAIVLGEQTASAGEMLAVVLAGEAATHSFGLPTLGLTTSNLAVPLQDGSVLISSQYRFALGNGAPIRGKLLPMTPAEKDTPRADIVRQAADWASTASPLCRKEKS